MVLRDQIRLFLSLDGYDQMRLAEHMAADGESAGRDIPVEVKIKFRQMAENRFRLSTAVGNLDFCFDRPTLLFIKTTIEVTAIPSMNFSFIHNHQTIPKMADMRLENDVIDS
jgi:hypothetical protein